MKRCAIAILFLALSRAGAAEPPQTPAAAPNSGLAADNAKAAATGETTAPKPSAPSLENGPKTIGDPTQMTGSFTEALSRIQGKPGGAAPAQPDIPKIDLTAKVYLQGSKAVMLRTGEQSHLIKEGEKFSFLNKNTLYEIQLDRIESSGVTLTVLPPGRKLILQ